MGQLPLSRGFSLIEILLSVALLAMVGFGIMSALWRGEESLLLAEKRNEAIRIADTSMEGLRTLRDASFDALTPGTYGLTFTEGSGWALTPTPSQVNGEYTRSVTINNLGQYDKEVSTTISWNYPPGKAHTLTSSTRMSNWVRMFTQAEMFDLLNLDNVSATAAGGGGEVSGIEMTNIGGRNLYIQSVRISWVTDTGQKIEKLSSGGSIIWEGQGNNRKSSGDTISFNNFIIPPGNTIPIDVFETTGTFSNHTMTMVFTMIDGSQKSFTFPLNN